MTTQHWDSPPRRIVVFRALQLGDMLVAVPALRALRRGFPEAEITLIGLPWAASFAARFTMYIDRFVEFVGYPGIDEAPYDPARTQTFLAEQRAYGYDLAIQLHGNGRVSNHLLRDLGARTTCAYYPADTKRPRWLTFAAPYPEDEAEILRNLGLPKLFGCPIADTRMEFPLATQDVRWARKVLDRTGTRRPRKAAKGHETGIGHGDHGSSTETHGTELRPAQAGLVSVGLQARFSTARAFRPPRIGLHPGARPPARRWPAEYFAAIADDCVRRFGARVVITGGPGEEATAQAVLDHMREPALNLAGRTTLGSLAALIADLDLFISNDTGPAHLANAVGTKSVTLFGPADPRRWAPLDLAHHPIVRHPVPCSPCSFWECPIDHRCLRGIAPAAVMDMAATLLTEGAVVCDA